MSEMRARSHLSPLQIFRNVFGISEYFWIKPFVVSPFLLIFAALNLKLNNYGE